jgi:glycosyltransferase involved in cell wall biosynthesis
MRIFILQDYLRAGGTERQSVALSRFFAALGHDTTLLTFRSGGDLAPPGGEVSHFSLQRYDSRWNGWAPGLVRTLRKAQPDIVLCMGYYANVYAGWVQSRLPSSRVVGTLRTLHKMPWWLAWSWRGLPLVISNTRAGRDILTERFNFAPERVIVIPNALAQAPDFKNAKGHRVRQRERQGAQKHTLVLLNVGMFRKEKKQAELIRIVADWKPECDWQLWLLGNGPLLDKCRRLARKLPKVRFLDYEADVAPFYASADAAVLTSKMEALPNFLCEAQAWGLPVVSYDVGGAKESFEPGASGYAIPYGRKKAFEDALSILARDTEKRAAMSAAANLWAQRYDPRRQSQAYLDCFRSLISSGASSGGADRTG